MVLRHDGAMRYLLRISAPSRVREVCGRGKCRPHPEELAKQASRRMDATHGLPAILRDARKSALLRRRSPKRKATRRGASRPDRWRWLGGSKR